MRPLTTLLAAALVSLPITAQAQPIVALRGGAAAVPTVASPAETPASPRPTSLTTPVRLTRSGVHSTVEHTLVSGLEVVDQQQVDVDADGDLDVLALLDLAETPEPKPNLGRGVVVVFRERRGWRGQTVASVPMLPMEAGYNWGRAETLRAGSAPLLHVMFSQAGAMGARQADTVIQHDHAGAFREVYSAAAESVAGSGEGTVVRALEVSASDVDGDGTSELLERVASSAHCPSTGCVTPDGMVAPTLTRRVFHWNPITRVFEPAPGLEGHHAAAVRALDAAQARLHAGDSAGRDAELARAFALDPLDAHVRMAYARLQLRSHAFAAALDTLEFSWPEGFGRDARLLQAEAAARAGSAQCGRYLALLRNDDPARGAALEAQLGPLSSPCRAASR